MADKNCFLCGAPIVFRATRVNPKTGKMEWRAKPFPIHIERPCSQQGNDPNQKTAE